MSRRADWPGRPWIPPVLIVLCGALVTARVVLWSTKPEDATAYGPSRLWWVAFALGVLGAIASGLHARQTSYGRRGLQAHGASTGHRACHPKPNPAVTVRSDAMDGPSFTRARQSSAWDGPYARTQVGRGEPYRTSDDRAEGEAGFHGIAAGTVGRWVLVFAISLVAGLALATTSLERQGATHGVLTSHSVSSIAFRVERDATPTETGWWTSAEAFDGGRALGPVWISSPVRSLAGDVLRGVGRYEANDESEFGVSSRMRGIPGTVSFATAPASTPPQGPGGLLQRVRRALVDAIDPTADEGRALTAGAALGSKEGLKAFRLDDAFSKAGLSHLVAVSGLHVALATSLLSAVLLRLGCPRGIRLGCLVLWGGVYVMLCGAPSSALRSLAMAGASQGADLVGRRAHGLGAVGVVGLAMALVDVGCVGDLGFLLSIVCVAALGILSPWTGHLLEVVWPDVGMGIGSRRVRRRLVSMQRAARGTLAASLICLAVSLPLVAASFGSVSLLSPLANLAVAPLFEGFLVVALAASLIGWIPMLGPLAVSLTAWLGRGIVLMVRGFGCLPWGQAKVSVGEPWATIAVPVLIGALYLVWPRPGRRHVVAGLGLLAVGVLGWWFVRPLLMPPRVVVLDVGQGDAILVQDGPHSLLVDTGPDDAVVGALSRQGIASLDAVVFTHEHADHAGGFPALMGYVTVGALYVPAGQADCLAPGVDEAAASMGCPVVEVGIGDRIDVGRFELTVLWPEGPEDGDENDECLVARLDFSDGSGRLRALLTGDAESDVLDGLVRSGEVGDLDLLKVGHHGSEVSVDAGALAACEPEVAVASAGEGNSYGHPDPVCVETCEDAGALFLCTKDVGDVEVRPGTTGPVVSTQRPLE